MPTMVEFSWRICEKVNWTDGEAVNQGRSTGKPEIRIISAARAVAFNRKGLARNVIG